MENFENDLIEMAQNVEFREVNNSFQHELKKDMKDIKSSNKAFIPADKTRNIYEMDKQTHNKLLHENITKNYRKTSETIYHEINSEAKKIATKLGIDNKVPVLAKKNAFITLKDHKENFDNAPKCRLINPAKSELGRVSKQIIEKINAAVRESTEVQQWRRTKDTINWFNSIEGKASSTFIQFDIVDFYPSITQELLNKAIEFAKNTTTISDEDLEIIMHARKSLLFDENSNWIKKDTEENFDVSMGSYDGAEVCELVGLYLLNQLSSEHEKPDIGLYRDDGLAIMRNSNPRKSDQARKQITRIFKNNGLQITIETNLKEANFLDVTLNLTTGTYKPYRKPNDHPVYISTKSNHPPNVIKQLPQSIGKRISENSASKEIFDEAAPYYNEALRASGYTEQIQFQPPATATNNPNRNRKRNITWFNPPYSMNVKTNIAKNFLQLIDKHFPPSHKYHKIFNRNNVKVSYSCMSNAATIIQSHNRKILSTEQPPNRNCNCRQENDCPLQGNCLSESVIYRAKIKTNPEDEGVNYIGLTENSFKDRLYKHRNSFRYENKRKSTELSKYIWSLKDKKIENYKLEWSIIDKAPAYKNGGRRCELCLTEKFNIIFQKYQLLNKRNELLSNCRHVNKYLLRNFKHIPPGQ